MNIRGFVKKNRLLTAAAYTVRQKGCRLMTSWYGRLPIDSGKVLFFRSGGGYGDNPRAIAEYLHTHYPNLRLVWAYNSKVAKDSIPDYLKAVPFETGAFFRELATAGAWVCSTTLPAGTKKRKGQLYIQTWHGDKFLKKIANDARADVTDYQKRTASRSFCESQICDYYVTGCEWFVPIAASALDYNGAFLRCGMPRNDCLVRLDAQRCTSIRKALGISEAVKVLLYAPTFRDYEKSSGEIDTDIDLIAILDRLERKYGCRWLCLTRAHHGKEITINGKTIADERFRDVTAYPDMADLLMISDMLVSDYSSCGADFAITGKMVLLYQDDIERYTAKGRTLYFSREESPYFTASNMAEALAIIDRVSEEDIRKNSREILDFYRSFESGHACETVSKVIVDALEAIKNRNPV